MTIDKIITFAVSVIGFIVTVAVPTVVVLVRKVKNLKAANNDAERAAIVSDILSEAKNLVVAAEELYKDTNAILKAQGKSCGALKKDKVMTDIQQLCLSKGINFDKDFWSAEVEKIVAVTKKVNAAQ